MIFKPGDVVRSRWPFTDMSGEKMRPAVVLTGPDERAGMQFIRFV